MDKLQDFSSYSTEGSVVIAQQLFETPQQDHNFVLNTLHHLAGDIKLSKNNFWMLTQYALRNIRVLQDELTKTNQALDEKNARIAELEQLVSTDCLTGLVNRRGFMEALEQDMDRTRRNLINGGLLIMIDLDNFKSINDTYGHQAGDEALKLVAQTLKAHIRRMDTAARLGGDEFVLIFSNANAIQASPRIQKLAQKLNSLSLKYNSDFIPVRASIGVHPYGKGDSMDTIITKADMAMYEAKEKRKLES